MSAAGPRGRWQQQHQRIADVLRQRADALRDVRDEASYRPVWGDRWREMRDYVEALVDTFPPLTAEQRDRLAMLLRPGLEKA